MLGKLARKLRILGFDTLYESSIEEEEVLEKAKGRILLTRDKELAKRAGGVYIESDDYREQLRTVAKKFGLSDENMLTRCSVCNEVLVPIDKEKIKDRVPKYVYEHHDEFYICPKCNRVYWYGSHTERIEKEIHEILGGTDED